jgi:hypothetical protein
MAFQTVKIGGIWQVWNVTCDGSIIVENGHRNMGFFKIPSGKKVKALINDLKAVKPVFSLSTDSSKVVLDSDLAQEPNGFHVFDYMQLQEAGIDINTYVQGIDFRLGSFVIFKRKIFTAERIADELDTYLGEPFLVRTLINGTPAPIEPTDIFEVIIPSEEDVKIKLLESFREYWCDEDQQCDQNELEEEVEDYIAIYCYPDLNLKIPLCWDE